MDDWPESTRTQCTGYWLAQWKALYRRLDLAKKALGYSGYTIIEMPRTAQLTYFALTKSVWDRLERLRGLIGDPSAHWETPT